MVSLRETIKSTLGASDADLADGVAHTCLNPLFKASGSGAREQLTYGGTGGTSTTLSVRRMFLTWEFPSTFTDTTFDEPSQSGAPAYADHVEGLAAAPDDNMWFLISNDEQAVVAPPQYGRWQAGEKQVGGGANPPSWLEELNVDPRHRGSASRGTAVVQDQQEPLMSQAWEQVGQLRDVNKLHRWAQFSRQVGSVTHDRLVGFRDGLTDGTSYRKFHLLAPILDRVVLSSEKTALGALRDTDLPEGVFSAAFRRLLRSRGPHFKDRLEQVDGTYVVEEDLANCNLEPTEAPEYLASSNIAWTVFYSQQDNLSNDPVSPQDFRDLIDNEIPTRYSNNPAYSGEQPVRDALLDTIAALDAAYMPEVENPPAEPDCTAQDIPNWTAEVEAALDPETTLVDHLQSRIALPAELVWQDDALAPVIVAPDFPQPMYVPLAETYPDLLLPGIGEVPNNSVTALETNPHFIEAYMCGLNHEMSREFLWREYPCDLRGSFFRQFWDIRGIRTETDRELLKDIEPIHLWANAPDALGENMQTQAQATPTGPQGRTVLLFRGELFKRYPNAIVFAIRAQWNTSDTPATREPLETLWSTPFPDPANSDVDYPMFSGHLSPDIRFFGFDLLTADAKGSPDPADADAGYFFVIQQRPTDTRMGLDNPGSSDPSWDQTACYDAGTDTWTYGCYITPSDFSQNADDGAAMAGTLLQKPYRIAIHADELIA